MEPSRKNWLVMAGPLSGYIFDLFDSIAALGEVDVRFLHGRLDGLPSFEHESRSSHARRGLCWKDASWADIRRFVREPVPDAAFVYGTQPRLKLSAALACLPRQTPLWYAADTNIGELTQHPARTFARRLAYWPLVRRTEAALSLGASNRWALEALGFRRIVDLPVYAVDFAALDAAANASTSAGAGHEIVLLIIARLVPVKNLPATVAALAREPDLAGVLRLVIAGEGPDRPALEEIQRRFPLLKMELLGAVPRSNTGALFLRADALLLPSLVEPWGIVIVEALGMGLPVIATPAVGAAVSLAGSSDAITLCSDNQPRSVVAGLRRFLEERSRLKAAAREGVPAIRARFGRIEVAQATLRLVCGGKSNR
jgi:glycosyltransferase involved in cell wall biosynthesis